MSDYSEALDRFGDEDVICLEVYGREYVAVVWEDPDLGPVANLRFGSGRHYTAVDPELERIVEPDSIQGVNIVSTEDAKTL